MPRGLDYLGARYYAPTLGRFLTPDWSASPEAVPYASLSNPQSLNLYSYVLNNPATAADADGHCPQCAVELVMDWIEFQVAHPAAAARVEQGAEGVGMIVGGSATVVGSAGGGALSSETGVGIAAGLVGVQAGVGMAVGGVVKLLMSAVTGKDAAQADDAAAAVQTIANPAGLATTVGDAMRGGSPAQALAAGANAAAVADAATAAAGLPSLVSGGTLDRAVEVVGLLQAGADVKKATCREQTACDRPPSGEGVDVGAAAKPGGGK